ncbi:MAG TPA: FtsX-like permease family protein [Vicinamibacterales bacterium]|nr:FtsX-like permease family protein [Vicinamibacterales bacterium]
MNRLISWGEVRLGLRLIVKQPILSVTVILALATGICFATMGYTFREELVNGSLPYAAGDRFARIFALTREGARVDLDIERYQAIRERATSFEYVGAVAVRPFTLTHARAEVESIDGTQLTPGAMRWLDAVPLAGRAFVAEDGAPGAEPVVLIRESLWRRRYSADAALIGRAITVGGEPRIVVGVMPDSFLFPASGELWMPLEEATLRNTRGAVAGLRTFGVLRRDVAFETADAEVAQVVSPFPSSNDPDALARTLVRPFTADSDDSEIVASALVGVLVLLLLVVASNVATLVFARTWSRAPELAVRTALGANRARVVGQLFVETLLLGSVAAVIGLIAAHAALQYFRQAFADEGWPFWITLEPNPRVVFFVVLLTLLVSVVSGLLPALRVTRHNLRDSLQAGRGFAAGGFGRIGAVLLVLEIALSIALLNGAVTMARAFSSYVNEIPGLPQNRILTARLGRIRTPAERDRVVAAARALPGVVAAGAGQHLPRLYPPPRPTAIEPLGDEPVTGPRPAPGHAVGEGFLEAIGARAIAGRLLDATDFTPGAPPVAVVNEPFVAKFLGGRNPIGRRMRIDDRSSAERAWREIVGVVPDLGLSVGDPELTAGFYIPVRDETLWYLAIRTTADPLALTAALRAAVANVDTDLQLDDVRTLEEAGYEERVFLSAIAMSLTAMGGIALLLSIVGIYALLSFMVTRRTREIGIRVALGARPWQVLRSITAGAAAFLMVGGVLGTILGIIFAQARAVILISIPAPGFWMPATIFLTLAIAGLTACWLPARRALRIRPSEALAAD